MGPFKWVATYWTPAIEYRDYPANEVEDIAWESTTVGSKRGFLVGFVSGALFIMLLIIGVVMAGLYRPFALTAAPPQVKQDAAAWPSLSKELNGLREENQALKAQLMKAKAVAPWPPCQPQEPPRNQTRAPAVPPSARPAKQATTSTAPQPKPTGSLPAHQVPQPIPSTCRQESDCQ